MNTGRLVAKLPSLVLCGLLVACQPAPQHDTSEDISFRPVLTSVVDAPSERSGQFAGVIASKNVAVLTFSTSGRLAQLGLKIGQLVEAGITLGKIDDSAIRLQVRAAAAELSSARVRLVNLSAEEQRQTELLARSLAPRSVVEQAEQARISAQTEVARLEAALTRVEEGLGAAELRSPVSGVVTSVSVEEGQVITAGQAVATIAAPDVLEAVLHIPEPLTKSLQQGQQSSIWRASEPNIVITGSVREILPQVERQTRTREVRVSLELPPESFRLGSTLQVQIGESTLTKVVVPNAALAETEKGAAVWVVDPNTSTVTQRMVQLGGTVPDGTLVEEGLKSGERLVVSGADQLTDGQAVRFIEARKP